jgi:hypothetical protein
MMVGDSLSTDKTDRQRRPRSGFPPKQRVVVVAAAGLSSSINPSSLDFDDHHIAGRR